MTVPFLGFRKWKTLEHERKAGNEIIESAGMAVTSTASGEEKCTCSRLGKNGRRVRK